MEIYEIILQSLDRAKSGSISWSIRCLVVLDLRAILAIPERVRDNIHL